MSDGFLFSLPGLSELEDIHSCYRAFGKENAQHGLNCFSSAFPRWRNATMSPRIMLTRESDTIVDMAKDIFASNPPAGPFDSNVPYFNLHVSLEQVPSDGWIKAIAERGFVLRRKSTLVLFDKPLSSLLPAGFHFSSGSVFDRRLKKQFLEVMHDAFPDNSRKQGDLFWLEIFKGIRLSEGNTRVVILETARGKAAGAGLVTSNSNGAFLWCGGIKSRYRGRGLARPLMGLRQLVSSEDGCKRWLYSTSNPRIEKFGDRRYVDFSFVLNAEKEKV